MSVKEGYIANWRNYPKDEIKIRVARPSILAPSKVLLEDWKQRKITLDEYTVRFSEEVFSNIDAFTFLIKIRDLSSEKNVRLMSYEKEPLYHTPILKGMILMLTLYGEVTDNVMQKLDLIDNPLVLAKNTLHSKTVLGFYDCCYNSVYLIPKNLRMQDANFHKIVHVISHENLHKAIHPFLWELLKKARVLSKKLLDDYEAGEAERKEMNAVFRNLYLDVVSEICKDWNQSHERFLEMSQAVIVRYRSVSFYCLTEEESERYKKSMPWNKESKGIGRSSEEQAKIVADVVELEDLEM